MNRLKEQLHIFFNALTFFSRLPAPAWVRYDQSSLNLASGYFPLVGWILGSLLILFWLAVSTFVSTEVAIVMVMALSIWLTGAFHEDGFADLCDGFGGGYGQSQILTIMKDSRLGTYGACGLVFMLGTKYLTLTQVAHIPITLLVGYSLSRVPPVWLMAWLDYVRDDEMAKARPVAKSIAARTWILATVIGMASLLLLSLEQGLYLLVALAILTFVFGRYLKRVLSGFTGDCLGALQQLSEVTIYLLMGSSFWN